MRPPLACVVRSATPDDAERISALSGQLGYPSTPSATAARLKDILGRPEHAVLVAETDGALVGWIQLVINHSLLTDTSAEIAGLIVDEHHRSNGLGRLLVEHAERWALENNLASIRVRSNLVRERTHAFYERLGYEAIKTQKAFRKQLA